MNDHILGQLEDHLKKALILLEEGDPTGKHLGGDLEEAFDTLRETLWAVQTEQRRRINSVETAAPLALKLADEVIAFQYGLYGIDPSYHYSSGAGNVFFGWKTTLGHVVGVEISMLGHFWCEVVTKYEERGTSGSLCPAREGEDRIAETVSKLLVYHFEQAGYPEETITTPDLVEEKVPNYMPTRSVVVT